MQLLKPSWVAHDGHPIFSLDIHPDGSRFATGGQGEDSGRIVIWNMAPVVNEADEKDENVPKMLCQLDNHLACVNCVRWSNTGKYLASGGDDKLIMIWQTGRYGTSTNVFGGGGKVNVEQWRCVSTLRGHTGDILDLAWSPHDAWLASCSVDNTVVVWNALKFPETLSVLRGHTGLVKGVSWDPVGKYLASQSDDKSLQVWRTVDWQQETIITKPFDECGGTTHVLRLSWSPDGQYIVSAHAMNNSGPTAQIIDRDGWKTEKDFVGHRKAITVAKFNPNILSKVMKDSSKVQHYCCCAIGSRDRSLSVWLTALKRPLVVIHDLFSNSVMDVSWSRTGHQLLVCSWDGTVAYVDFSEEEIGRPLSNEEQSLLHQKMYGKSLAMTNHVDSTTMVIENPEMLRLKDQQREMEVVEQQRQQETHKANQAVKGPINKQIETRTADGHRRITPMFIAPAPDLGEAPLPFNSKPQPTFSSSSQSKSTIIIEKRDEVSTDGVTKLQTSGRPPDTIQPASPKPISSNPTSAAVSPVSAAVAAGTAASGGGVATPAGAALPSAEPSSVPDSNVKSAPIAASVSIQSPKPAVCSEKNDRAAGDMIGKEIKVKVPDSSIPVKRKEPEDQMVKPVKRRPGRPPLAEKLAAAAAAAAASSGSPKHVRVANISAAEREGNKTSHAHSTFHLPALKADKFLSVQVPGSKPDASYVLELENNSIPATGGVVLHRLRCLQAGNVAWEVLLSSRGVTVAGSSSVIAVVCDDNSLNMFSPTGRRFFPAIVLLNSISRLLCSDHFVMVITTKAYTSVWDVKNQKILVKHESLHSIMTGGPSDLSILSSSLTSHGAPVISLSSGKAFIFNHTMGTWMLISNSEDVIQQCSDHHMHMPTAQVVINGNMLPLAALQAQSKKPLQQAQRIFRSLPAMQQTGTISHLDGQLAAAMALHSPREFRFWLLTLVRFLVHEGLEVRLRDICNDLLGPIQRPDAKLTWNSHVLGLRKRDLLGEILPIIGSNLRLQRLFTEYRDQQST